MTGPDIEDLYRRYAPMLTGLFRTRLLPEAADEATNDTFTALYQERDRLGRTSDDAIRSRLSVLAYEQFKKQLGLPDEVEVPIDASGVQEAMSRHDPEEGTWFDFWAFEDMLEIKQANPADALTEAILAAAAPGLIDRDLIAAAEPDVEILSSFLSQISTAKKCGLSLGQLLAPFSRPTLLDPQRLPLDPDTRGAVELSAQLVSAEMLRLLAANPERLHELTPRQFEEVVAELFAKQGYDVTLTATSRDGGADLYVVDNNAIGSFLYLVECKRYHPGRPVGVGIVRGLFGAAQAARATAGIVATSSYFTRDAKAFQQEVQYQVSLRDFAALQSWLHQAR